MPAFDLPLPELKRHRPEPDEPDDFDAFWRDTLKEAGQPAPLVSVRPVESGLRLTNTWDVTFRGFAGIRCAPGSACRQTLGNPFRWWSSTSATDAAAASPTSA